MSELTKRYHEGLTIVTALSIVLGTAGTIGACLLFDYGHPWKAVVLIVAVIYFWNKLEDWLP
jgi:hypothetical protein